MRELLERRWDARFQFSAWDQPLMNALMAQQERLKLAGTPRQVCILIDDIILSSKDEDALSHLCLRGRHFNISVLAAAVSYTTLPKRCRRALDCLFLFSVPMSGDRDILCKEYAQQARMARYCLQNLPEYTCLVMETLTRQQRLYHYRAPHRSHQTPASSSLSEQRSTAVRDLHEPHQETPPPLSETSALLSRSEGGPETCQSASSVSEKCKNPSEKIESVT